MIGIIRVTVSKTLKNSRYIYLPSWYTYNGKIKLSSTCTCIFFFSRFIFGDRGTECAAYPAFDPAPASVRCFMPNPNTGASINSLLFGVDTGLPEMDRFLFVEFETELSKFKTSNYIVFFCGICL